jgi:antagonist of KipI
MKSIIVEAAGLLTTVQDLGRHGFGPIGVSPAGAADTLSLRLGNRLVGNPENAAALEMTLLGGSFRFPQGAIAALAGSNFGASLDNAEIAVGESFEVRSGQTLRLGPARSGARCYLCVRGGIVVPPVLGSSSTHLLSHLGGFDGRPLRRGDVLAIGESAAPFRRRVLAPRVREYLSARNVLRVTPGPQAEWFSGQSSGTFYSTAYRVAEQSNRVGLRLEGARLPQEVKRPMITEGVSLGAIQVPSSGLPIILFVDQQTTGGYPKIANVISVDLHRVGQLRPRDEICFEQVTFDAARALLLEQEDLVESSEAILE